MQTDGDGAVKGLPTIWCGSPLSSIERLRNKDLPTVNEMIALGHCVASNVPDSPLHRSDIVKRHDRLERSFSWKPSKFEVQTELLVAAQESR